MSARLSTLIAATQLAMESEREESAVNVLAAKLEAAQAEKRRNSAEMRAWDMCMDMLNDYELPTARAQRLHDEGLLTADQLLAALDSIFSLPAVSTRMQVADYINRYFGMTVVRFVNQQ